MAKKKILVKIEFTHYSPKDGEEGVKEYIVASSMEQALAYIDKEYLYDWLDEEDEDEEGSFSPTEEWISSHPEKMVEASQVGLKVDEYGVEGDARTLTRWLESEDWKEVTDAYYGVTHHKWSDHREISPKDAEVLIRLGIAKDISTTP